MLIALLLALAPGWAIAQTTSGSITGSISDPNQAAISNAVVRIEDSSRGFSLSATTDNEGRFVFPTLRPGTYTLRVEAAGFKKLERTGIVLVANDKLTLGDIVVQVGAASETITVTAEATQVQAESAERSYALQAEAVQNIAVNGRGFIPLASLATGVIFTNNTGNNENIQNIAANGLRTSANNLQLDGVSIVDTGNNGTMISVTLDAIAEFKVLTSNYQAEYGRSAGAQISAVTRGGSREFHGSFYAFRRHDGMNANTWINNRDGIKQKPRLDQRDIGYTIGGPVYIPGWFNKEKDKLFFFFSQEHQKRFTPPAAPVRVTVPTALERDGDFSKSVDSAGQPFPYIRDYTLNLPCSAADTRGCFQAGGVVGRIPANRLYSVGLNILKIYPLPNITGNGFNYQTEAGTSQPQRQDLYRGDWAISNNWRANGKYLYYKNSPTFPYGSFVLASNLPDYPARFPNNRYTVGGTVTGSLTPTTVLEVNFGQSHNFIDILPGNPKFNKAGLGLSNIPLLYTKGVQIDMPPQFQFGGRIANGPNIGSSNAPFYNFNTTRDLSTSLSKIKGSHNLKFGFYWQNSFKPQSSFAANNGVYNFNNDSNNPFDSGFGFANAALGVYNTFSQASDYIIGQYRYNNLEWYVQDNWRVTSRLTLDYGIRFNWIQPQFDEAGQTGNFLPDQYKRADASLLYRPVCIGGANPCSGANRRAVDPRLLTGSFVASTANTIESVYIGRLVPNTGNLTNGVFQAGKGVPKGVYKNRGVHYGPRFGFAYDLKGDQTMVVRGGGGVFYDRPQGNTVFDLVQNPPTTIIPTFFYGRMQDIGTGQVLLAPPALVAFDLEGKVPTSYAYNLGVQYKLPLDSVLDISYVGTKASHLIQRRNLNAPAYGAAYLASNQDPTLAASTQPGATALPVDFLRPYAGFGNISYIEPAASSNYHSLQTSINRRFRAGLLLGVNYTWSKALGTQTNDLPGINGFGAVRIDGNERRANYGPLDFDRRHNFNVNWVYELPKFTNSTAAGLALNNWQVSGIYRFQTGAPYNVGFTIPGISAYTLTGTQTNEGARVALTGKPGSGGSSDPYRQFDVSAFAAPKPGSLGLESGRNFLYRPAINSWDLALSKEFRIKERVRFEVRLDAFNALNHTQFDGINSTLVVRSFADPTPTNLATESTRSLWTGFGAVTSVRPPRNMQLSARFQF
ncbi:MAG: carboxypeptidase regulatory-like domain-containing protein [Blastocatellia bacterium]